MSLFEIGYISTADAYLGDEDIDAIRNAASARHEAEKITGVLMYNGVNFAEILEGAKDAIDRIFANIESDPRHSGIIKIFNREVARRSFADWQMIVVPESNAIFAHDSPFARALKNPDIGRGDTIADAVEELKSRIFAELKAADSS